MYGASEVWCSSNGSSWSLVTSSGQFGARCNHSSVVHNGKMWIIGGYKNQSGGGYQNDLWSSSDGITWTQVTSAAGFSARGSHSSVIYDEKIWVFGGSDYNGCMVSLSLNNLELSTV
jgi:hypothetical protein